MATLKDIAGVTGISISTISRVLNHDETISVTPQTAEKIFAAAKALDYVPTRSRAKAESAAPNRRMGIAQMFEMEQILEDPYYLYMKSALEKMCFSKGVETSNLFRDQTGHFICQGDSELDGVFAIGSFTPQEIEDFTAAAAMWSLWTPRRTTSATLPQCPTSTWACARRSNVCWRQATGASASSAASIPFRRRKP